MAGLKLQIPNQPLTAFPPGVMVSEGLSADEVHHQRVVVPHSQVAVRQVGHRSDSSTTTAVVSE